MNKVKKIHIGFIELTYFELISFLIICAIAASWLTTTLTLSAGLKEVTMNQLLSLEDQQAYHTAFMASFLLFSFMHIIIGLLVWLCTRYVSWTLITGRPFDSHHLMSYFIHATPFVVLQLFAFYLISRFGNFILAPIVNSGIASLLLAFAIIVILINPLLIIVGVFGASAFYRFFRYHETKYFGWYLFFKKAKHGIDWGRWQQYVLRLVGLFVILNIAYLGVATFPAQIRWFFILLIFVMFISWSKLYLVKKEAL